MLTPVELAHNLKRIIYEEISTLRIRQQLIERECLKRWFETVETVYGPVPMKIADLGVGKIKYSPECEDCTALAVKLNLPIQNIMKAADEAFFTQKR